MPTTEVPITPMTNETTRRELLVQAAAVAGACACCALSAGVAFAEAPAKDKTLTLGRLSDYPQPGFYDKFNTKPNHVLVSRLDDRLVAMTAICTHKGCPVKVQADDHTALKCPCHKAEFSVEGTPTAGPAKTALVRYALTQAADGTITADLTRTFIESKWDDKASFVPLKPDAK